MGRNLICCVALAGISGVCVAVAPESALMRLDTRFEVANRAVTGDVTVINIPWCFKDGRIDWLFNPTRLKGPQNDEWMLQLNRMPFWFDLARAYQDTGNEVYSQAFVRQLEDWLVQTGGVPPDEGYNASDSPWRTIAEGIRLMGSWLVSWRAFQKSPAFTPMLRRRFLDAAHVQAQHLLRHPSGGGNWLIIEMSGVFAYATDFPPTPESAGMRCAAVERILEALRKQVLPDGLQCELSPDYHAAVLSCALPVYRKAVGSGRVAELPSDYGKILERMADAFLAMTTPSFVQPRFNDCYSVHGNRSVGDLAPLFPARADLAWFASNRKTGNPPVGMTASRFLPWGGFAVMRSGWDADATYLCFDVGPLGLQHEHQDKLSFVLWKGDEELVFDDGGGPYEYSPKRQYAVSGYGHNTLLVDGLAQNRSGPHCATMPIDAGWKTHPHRDAAFGVYDQGFGPEMKSLAVHRREVVFDKNKDVITLTDDVRSSDGQEHVYEILFQLDTTNTVVAANGRSLMAQYGRKWDLLLEVVEGGLVETAVARDSPRIAGWFVGRNDLTIHPAATVFVRSPRSRDFRFVTRLQPRPASAR